MKALIAFVFLLLAGCAYGTYQNGPVKVKVIAFGTDAKVQPVSDVSDKFGNHSVKMKGLDTEQSKTVSDSAGKIMEAVIKGAGG